MWHRCNLAAKESVLECACLNNDNFSLLVSGGGRCCWVSVCTVWPSHSKWLSEWSNESASNFALSLNRNYSDNSGQNFGQLWLATSSQCTCSCITSQAVFWQNINHPGDSATLTAPMWHPEISGFPQNWSHLWEGRDFRSWMRFRKIWQGSWWRLGELCEVPRCLLWRGLRHHCLMYNVSCIFNKCLYFS